MSGWRDQILRRFTVDVSRLTLALDPDGLIREERLADGVRSKGFDIISFEDAVSFRYIYESKYRSKWDVGEALDSSVVVRFDTDDPRTVPYDLLKGGRLLSFSIGDMFPNLSCPVVSTLDRADLDSLFIAQQQQNPDRLGDNSTREFILRHVFGIAPELIKTSPDLLRVLLRRHYTGQRIPKNLDDRFVQILRQNGWFNDWPLEEIVPHIELFYAFIQERWPLFVSKTLGVDAGIVVSDQMREHLKFSGPADLPFGHDDVHVYVDDLFLEGYLHTVEVDDAGVAGQLSGRDSWITVGIKLESDGDSTPRLREMLDSSDRSTPGEDCSHQDWMLFAHRWAQLSASLYKTHEHSKNDLADCLRSVQERVDSAFVAWMLRKYIVLHNQPPTPPVMVHHIPRFLARQMEDTPKEKTALVILDGMAYDQWVTIREALIVQEGDLLFGENAVFAWVPTVTSISRQAILAGKPPFFFPSTIGSTDAEPRLWQQFWSEHGLNATEVGYIKGIGERRDLADLSELVGRPRKRSLAIVVDKLDKIMHGMELGAEGMQNQVLQWAQQGLLLDIVRMLIDADFRVFLTSDHGNVESTGIGRPLEGAVADVRGERVRVYPSAELRSLTKAQFPDTLEWPAIGLPDGYLPLLAARRYGFVPVGETVVSHGGISLEEVVVPFVEVKRGKQ